MSLRPSTWRRNFLSRLLLPSLFTLLHTLPAQAILDTNNNTLSDLWETEYNNEQLFPNTADFLPTADPDHDNWINAQEAAAGTHPFHANPPDGIIHPQYRHIPATYLTTPDGTELLTPEASEITWPTLTGKSHTLYFSVDLTPGSWLPLGPPLIAAGGTTTTTVPLSDLNGGRPDKLFWRVAVQDADTDGDNLTNHEEHQLGTNPNSSDSDSDGLSDQAEVLAGLNLNNSDTDGDGNNDPQDADPKEWLVNWDKTSESYYALIDVEIPAGIDSFACDINDKGEVLFDEGIWAAGQWTPKEAPEVNEVCQLNGEETSYKSNAAGWSHFNDERQLLGSSEINFTSGQAAGGDELYSAMTWPETQSPGEMSAYVTPFFDQIAPSLHPLGITTSGTSWRYFPILWTRTLIL